MERCFLRLTVSAFILASGAAVHAAPPPNFEINTDAEYQSFTQAVRATEYVREGLVVERRNRRVVPAIVALSAFADRNVLATPEQLLAFVTEYDSQLEVVRPSDPEFRRPASVAIAVRGAFVEPIGLLKGTETDVADDVFARLGISIPGLDEGAREIRRRMIRFEEATSARLEFRAEFPETLTRVFAGRASDGGPRPGLDSAADAYLTSMGFSPLLGGVDPTRDSINAAIDSLPTFSEFQAIDGGALRALIVDDLRAIQDAGERIRTSLPADTTASTAITTTLTLSDTELDAAYDAAANVYEARMRETSRERTRALANSLLLSQPGFGALSGQAGVLNDFATVQLDANSGYAAAESGVVIGLGLAGIASAKPIGVKGGGPLLAAASAAAIGGEIASLAGLSSGPDLADIGGLIEQLSDQLENTRRQLNGRFDLVDLQLNATYAAMTTGLDQILRNQIIAQDGIDEILERSFELQSQLSRLETSLFALEESDETRNLIDLANFYLDFRFDVPSDLSFAEYSTGSNAFFTFVDATATDEVFAGPGVPPLSLSQAADVFDFSDGDLSSDDELVSIGRYLNDLNDVPADLATLPNGQGFAGPVSLRAPRPSFWTQGAAMYTQLAKENPWYFASQFELQAAGQDTDLDEIIREGERIVDLVTAARNPDLFAALVANARSAADRVQSEIDNAITTELTTPVFNLARSGVGQLDPWGPAIQAVAPRLTPTIDSFVAVGTGGLVYRTTDPNNTNTNGWERISTTDGDRTEVAREFATYFLTDHFEPTNWADGVPPVEFPFNSINQLTDRSNAFQTKLDLPDECGRINVSFRAASSGPNGRRWYIQRSFRADGGVRFGNDPLTTIDLRQFDEDFWIFAFNDRVAQTWDNGLWDSMESRLNSPSMPSRDVRDLFHMQNETRFLCGSSNVLPLFTTFSFNINVRSEDEFGVFRRERVDMPGRFKIIRDGLRVRIDQTRMEPTSSLYAALEDLDDATALLDAYLTLAFDDYFRSSEVLRSAFRSKPGASPVGVRRVHVEEMFRQARLDDRGALGGALADDSQGSMAVDFDLVNFDDELHRRLDVIEAEIDAALDSGGPTFPYIEYTLAELRSLKRDALRLAKPDTFEGGRVIEVSAGEGVLANDVRQLLEVDVDGGVLIPIFRDVRVDTGCVDGACPDEIELTTDQSGSVVLRSDGSFTYEAPVGFSGIDVFTYRSWNDFGLPSAAVASEPAMVVIRVDEACNVADIEVPLGVLDLSDVDVFITSFLAAGLRADIADPFGVLDLSDVDAFIRAFLDGCP